MHIEEKSRLRNIFISGYDRDHCYIRSLTNVLIVMCNFKLCMGLKNDEKGVFLMPTTVKVYSFIYLIHS